MRADLQRAASGMPVSAAPPTRFDNYPRTQRMGNSAAMAGTTQIPPVEDYDYAGGDYDQHGGSGGGSRRWIPWVLGLVLVIGVVAGVAYYLLAGGGKTYAVPLVNGEPLAQAQSAIRAAHLRSTPVNQASGTVRKGYVITTNPPEGNNEAAGTLVTLYVSSGAAPVTVPNVVEHQETAAEGTLQSAGFKVSVNPDPSSTAAAGTVLSQNPSSGGTALPGSTVTITVSGGAVPVPSVVGDFPGDREQRADYRRIPGRGPARVGSGPVRGRHGLRPAACQRQRGEGIQGHHLRAGRGHALRLALAPRPHRARAAVPP